MHEMIRHDLNDAAQMLIGAEFHLRTGLLQEARNAIERSQEIVAKAELAIVTEQMLEDVDKIPLKCECKEAESVFDDILAIKQASDEIFKVEGGNDEREKILNERIV